MVIHGKKEGRTLSDAPSLLLLLLVLVFVGESQAVFDDAAQAHDRFADLRRSQFQHASGLFRQGGERDLLSRNGRVGDGLGSIRLVAHEGHYFRRSRVFSVLLFQFCQDFLVRQGDHFRALRAAAEVDFSQAEHREDVLHELRPAEFVLRLVSALCDFVRHFGTGEQLDAADFSSSGTLATASTEPLTVFGEEAHRAIRFHVSLFGAAALISSESVQQRLALNHDDVVVVIDDLAERVRLVIFIVCVFRILHCLVSF